MDIHINKEDYRSRTPSCSKARGSHSHMYSGFYSSDIVQRKHRPRSLSHSPVCSQKNCYKLSDTSPQKPCETSHSRSPYHSRSRITHKHIDTSPNKEYETSQSRSQSRFWQRETDKNRDTFPKEQCERSRSRSRQGKSHKHRDTSPKPLAKEKCQRSRSRSQHRKTHKFRDTSPNEQCVRS